MSADILRILVVLLGIAVVAVVLIQQPKEGGMGMFTGGSGASGTVFGAKGSGSFLFRLTMGLALGFAILVIALVKVTNSDLGGSILSAEAAQKSAEVVPGKVDDATAAEEIIPGDAKVDSSNATIHGATNTDNSRSDAIPGAENTDSSDAAVPGSEKSPAQKSEQDKKES